MFYNIVQIGAFVGKDEVHDILTKETNATAILIEPVPWFYDKLMENYSTISNSNRITFSSDVINLYDGVCEFHCMENIDYKFNYQTEKNWGPEISGTSMVLIKEHEQYLDGQSFQYRTLNLNCISPKSFIKKHNITGIEFLKIDAEGMDFDLITNWPFDTIKPKYLQFEICHLDGHVNQKTKLNPLNSFLNKMGYNFLKNNGLDVIYALKN